MTKATVRDKVWNTAIDLAVNGVRNHPELEDAELDDVLLDIVRSSNEGEGFIKNDVRHRVEASDRTIHDVLKTMVDMQLLAATPRRLRRVVKRDLKNGTKTVNVTVYHPAGDLRHGETLEEADLIGKPPLGTNVGDGVEDIDEEEVARILREVGLE